MSNEKTLSVCMIVKDSEDSLGDCLRSLPSWIHEIVIADTGSTDRTKEIAEHFGAKIFDYEDPDPIYIDDKPYLGDFSAARNFAFDKCSGDYIFWIDSDDVLWEVKPGEFKKWFSIFCEQQGKDGVWMAYDYEHNEDGDCTMQHARERIVKRGEWTWRAPIHEVLCHNFEGVDGASIPVDQCRVVHISMGDHNHEHRAKRNMLVAEKALEKQGGEGEPRLHMNLANSYMGLGRYEEAIVHFQTYLEGSDWNGEKAMIHLSVSNCYSRMGETAKAEVEILKAIALEPQIKEPYIHMANLKLAEEDWDSALHWAETAINTEKDNSGYKCNPLFLKSRPLEVKIHSLMMKGELAEAKATAEDLLEKFPANKSVLSHLSILSNMLRRQEAVEAYKKIETVILQERDLEKLKKLRESAPDVIARDEEIAIPPQIRRDISKKTICIYCGEGFTTWGANSIEKGGIGGSETAVIRMAYELKELGWHVEIYAYPPEKEEGCIEGVYWYPYWRMPTDVQYDVFVNWRTPYLSVPRPRARLNVVWLHDVQREGMWNEEVLATYDKVMVLSKSHRRNVEWIPDEKIMYSRNGLDPSFFEGLEDVERIPKRMVYASCPSRGLVHIADNWEKIREEHPDAEIDVFYGFNQPFRDQMKVSAYFRDVYDKCQRFFKQPGVHFHGMVDQRTLGRAFARASVWAYPCHFPEISCITAMQAQVSGAMPVTTRYWALDETVREGVRVGEVDKNIIETEQVDFWVNHLIQVLHNGNTLDDDKVKEAREYFLWSKVAEEWTQEFHSLLKAGSKASESKTTASVAT